MLKTSPWGPVSAQEKSAAVIGGDGGGGITDRRHPHSACPLCCFGFVPQSNSKMATTVQSEAPRGKRKSISFYDTLLGARRSFTTCLTHPTYLSGPHGVICPLPNQTLARGGIILWPIRLTPGAGRGVSLL